ncbi:DUF3392 family protein [Chitinispirillales bacterium ANBcel5]|uniref:DUF3392 family protein n=1 Tax=Cellulosispirillum alkaliphilum TaxID=3039283 RepID=UPI002A4FCAF4|nr:DUF3392 family protein [Chitinispirillales bacterium ANBcel5]
MDPIHFFSSFIRGHLQEICFGITAVTLMLSGRPVNSVVKKFTHNLNWFLRYCVYIVLCTVGYGFLSKVLYKGLWHWFANLNNTSLVLWVTSIYLVLAYLAKAQKEI